MLIKNIKKRNFKIINTHFFLISISFLLTIVYFNQYYLFNLAPFVQGDNSIKFWATARFSNLLKDGFILWDPYLKLGSSIFSNDIYRSSFSGNSMFLFFFKNKVIGQIFYLHIFIFLNIYGIIVLSKKLKLNLICSISISIIYLYSTSIKSEYLLNGFISYAFLPFIILFVILYFENNKLIFAIISGILLSLTHYFGNISISQFSFIFIFSFSIFLYFYNKKYLFKNIIKFNLLVFIIWISTLAFYIFPFVTEHLANLRSHKTGYSGFNIVSLFTSLIFPFTSMIFIEEKFVWTGLLTKFENMNFYSNLLFLPTIIYFLFSFKTIDKVFKIFFILILTYYLLGILENYIPILSYLTNLIKGTGWWRSLPIIIMLKSFCIGYFIQEIFAKKQINKLLKYYFYLYILFFFIIILVLIFCFINPNYTINVLDNISKLNVLTLENYLINYYLTNKIFFSYIFYLISYIFIIFILINNINTTKHFQVLFIVFLLINSISINYIYYPFNKGLPELYNKLNDNELIRSMKNERIAIVFNDQINIDKEINSNEKFFIQLAQTNFPEFQRLQSNVNFRGMVLNFYDIKAYTNGSTSNQQSLVNFHNLLTKGNKKLNDYFKNRSYGFFVDNKLIDTNMFQFLNIKYVFSSIEFQAKKYKYLDKLDNYFIYENINNSYKNFIKVPKNYKTNEGNFYEIINTNTDLDRSVIIDNDKPINKSQNLNNLELDYEIINYNFDLPEEIVINNSIQNNLLIVLDVAFHEDFEIHVNSKNKNFYKINDNKIGLFIDMGRTYINVKFKPKLFFLGIYFSLFVIILLLIVIFINILLEFRKNGFRVL